MENKMTVRALIARLHDFDQNAVVCVDIKSDLFAISEDDFREDLVEDLDIDGGSGRIRHDGTIVVFTTGA